MVSRKKQWVLTREAFEGLLSALDADRERAAERYLVVRRKLVKFFEVRGSSSPEDHADETINRVTRRLQEGEQVLDVDRYVYGVARLLFLEVVKEPQHDPIEDVHAARLPSHQPIAQSLRETCFEKCLANLPSESRHLIVNYYKDEKRSKIKNREELARNLGIPVNALRIRAHRIRGRLEECVSKCLAKAQTE